MNRRTFAGLFVGTFAMYIYGGSLIPLMPIYAKMRGASAGLAGSYVAMAFLSLAAGAVLGGRLSDRVASRRLLLIVAGALSVPLTWLVGRSTGVWPLIAMTAASWFPCGLYVAVAGAIAGRETEPARRGRVFGLLGTTGGIAFVIGPAFSGSIADAWGYPTLLAIIAAALVIAPAAALVLVREKSAAPATPAPAAMAAGIRRPPLGVAMALLLGAQVFISYTAGAGNLGSSLAMDAASYRAAQISGINAVASFVGLPLPFVFGWLSDRVGRKSILICGYLVRVLYMVLLMFSRTLWQFGTALALNGVAAASNSVSSALAADVVDPRRVGGAVAFLQGAQYLGQVAGLSMTGMLFQRAGLKTGFLVAAALGLAAAALTLAVRRRTPLAAQAPAPAV